MVDRKFFAIVLFSVIILSTFAVGVSAYEGQTGFAKWFYSLFGKGMTGNVVMTPDCGTIITQNVTLDADISCISSGDNALTIGANNIVLDCAGHSITREGLEPIGGYGIGTAGYNHVTIKNCIVSGFWNGGISINSGSDNTLSNNIANLNYLGIIVSGSSKNTIINNSVSGNWDGITLDWGSNNNIVSNNIARLNDNMGMAIADTYNNLISNNRVNLNGWDGIYIYGSSVGNIVTNNNASSNTNNGITAEAESSFDNIFKNNSATNNGNAGIYVISTVNSTITKNVANSNYYGIYLERGSNNNINNNNASLNANQGIGISYSLNNSLSYNTANLNGYNGISVSSPGCDRIVNRQMNWTTGKVGGALEFYRVGQYVEASDASFPMGASERTMEAWINWDGTEGRSMILGYGSDFASAAYGYRLGDAYLGSVEFVGYGNGDGQILFSLPPNVWTHLVSTYDGVNVKTYVDGALVSTQALSLNTVPSVGFRMGWGYDGDLTIFSGMIDEVAIYNRVLSDTEILQSYTSSSVGNHYSITSGLVSYWEFEEGIGTTTTDSVNSNQGVFFNGAVVSSGIFCSDNNIITSNTANSNKGSGIVLDSTSTNNIADNTLTSNAYDGISTSVASNERITGNRITTAKRCIKLSSSTGSIVKTNVCKKAVLGIVSDPSSDNLIESNIFEDISETAIVIDQGTNEQILNNSISNATLGINILGAINSYVYENLIENSINTIAVMLSADTTIDSNTLTNNVQNAPVADDSSTGTASDAITQPAADGDGDGVADFGDNCRYVFNDDQSDVDVDGVGDICDNCADVPNVWQGDFNSNGAGDVCDDSDGDGVMDDVDNCPTVYNDDQTDSNHNGVGDVCEVQDVDGDGMNDDVDQCPSVYGKVFAGCPYADKTIIDLQIVDQMKSGICGFKKDGKPESECKNLLEGARVKIFDRENANFVLAYGSKPSKFISGIIFESDVGLIGGCTTDATGTCIAGEDHPGRFLVVAKYTGGTTSVYTSKIKNFKEKVMGAYQDEKDDSDVDNVSIKDTMKQKKLHFMKTIKKDGTVKYEAGAMTIVSGSQLNVLYPEYKIWSGTTELYPFVMSSDDAWTADVCMTVPAGYRISAVMDEDGNMLGTSSCTQSFVAGETKVILFQMNDVGSAGEDVLTITGSAVAKPKGEPNSGFTLSTTHKGKKTKNSVTIEGMKKAEKDKQDKDLREKIKGIKTGKKSSNGIIGNVIYSPKQNPKTTDFAKWFYSLFN